MTNTVTLISRSIEELKQQIGTAQPADLPKLRQQLTEQYHRLCKELNVSFEPPTSLVEIHCLVVKERRRQIKMFGDQFRSIQQELGISEEFGIKYKPLRDPNSLVEHDDLCLTFKDAVDKLKVQLDDARTHSAEAVGELEKGINDHRKALGEPPIRTGVDKDTPLSDSYALWAALFKEKNELRRRVLGVQHTQRLAAKLVTDQKQEVVA